LGGGIVCLKEKRAGNTLEEIGIGKDFLNKSQQLNNKEKGWTNGNTNN
jgi:hypothetical protein